VPHASAAFSVDSFEGDAYDDMLSFAQLAKTFQGDVEGTSTVHMLAARPPVETSAAYVAVERFVGTVNGRSGSFVLLHFASPARRDWQVLADSGTDDLTGLTGTAVIGDDHSFALDYELP
jgi:hypothetical protein